MSRREDRQTRMHSHTNCYWVMFTRTACVQDWRCMRAACQRQLKHNLQCSTLVAAFEPHNILCSNMSQGDHTSLTLCPTLRSTASPPLRVCGHVWRGEPPPHAAGPGGQQRQDAAWSRHACIRPPTPLTPLLHRARNTPPSTVSQHARTRQPTEGRVP